MLGLSCRRRKRHAMLGIGSDTLQVPWHRRKHIYLPFSWLRLPQLSQPSTLRCTSEEYQGAQ